MNDYYVVIGLGATGFSCAHYLSNLQQAFIMMDTRENPPQLLAFKKEYPHVPLILGNIDESLLVKASVIVLSPGFPISHPVLKEARTHGIPIIGDIELFAQAVMAPVIGITGTNAKSTVTTLVGLMAEVSGNKTAVGGNLGTPVLDLLKSQATELFILELSSFQLETTDSLKTKIATILNITPDHMDRYQNFEAYNQAKHRIYRHCDIAICNRDDALTDAKHLLETQKWFFTLQAPQEREFGLQLRAKEIYLAFEDQLLLPVKDLALTGKHYWANVLAALSIGYAMNWPISSMLTVLSQFRGLPHRSQYIREHQGIAWYNDSKGTNVGATCAALSGLGSEVAGKLILIAGGVGKEADFHPLVSLLEKYVRHVVLIGEAAKDIAHCIPHLSFSFANTLPQAVEQAAAKAVSGDAVLLSPACASFDMFKDYEHRGNVFMQLVEEMK